MNSTKSRETQWDLLEAVLPAIARQTLSEHDLASLRYLAQTGVAPNSLRALVCDLAYLEAWAKAATGEALVWPAPENLALKFVAHHFWDVQHRQNDATHGMPEPVAAALKTAGFLRADGPPAPSTVRRRLASWTTLHRWKGFDCALGSPSVRAALRLAVRASDRVRTRKSAKAVTRDILERLLATCAGDRLVDHRDGALLLVAFAGGGRRRSELAGLRVDHLVEDFAPDAAAPSGEACLIWRLGRTKTSFPDQDACVYLVGRPVIALRRWLQRAKITEGPIFRPINRWGEISSKTLTPQSVNLILKTRCEQAGLDPKTFSAHGFRSGFLTEAARQGVPLPEAMAQSQHRSVQQAARYYNDAERKFGRAVRISEQNIE